MGDAWWWACERRDALSQVLEQPLEVLRTMPGTALEGIGYRHPLLERHGRVVLEGDMVTADSGTGLVHIAPGHGAEDFVIGRRYGLPTLCPVDGAGHFTAEAGPFAGLNVLEDANPAIIAALMDGDALLASVPYTHLLPLRLAHEKTHHLPCHRAMVCFVGRLPGRGPDSHWPGHMASRLRPEPH